MNKTIFRKCWFCKSEIFKEINWHLVNVKTDDGITVTLLVDDDAKGSNIYCAKCGRELKP